MKYNILIKYINSIPSATKENGVDISRIQLLCEKLGRVNIGAGHIYLSGGMYAHGCGLALESILVSSGYPVARITDAYGFDIKRSIYLDGVSPSVEEFTSILTHIREILKKSKDVSFLREEVVFAFCLYVSKILGAKYVIFENTRDEARPMFEICAPYNFAITPRIYGEADASELAAAAFAIDKVNRGVVTGNNQYYKYFSDKCHKAGIRLLIHRSVDVIEEKMRQQTFVYNKREYTVKSSSAVFRDAVISVLELADMMKNHGIKAPPSAILEGIKRLGNCGFLEMVSLSPMILSDVSSTEGQLALTLEKIREIRKRNDFSGVRIVFDSNECADIISEDLKNESGIFVFDAALLSQIELADAIMSPENSNMITLILGGLEFTESVKGAVKAKMDKL